jgi:hypothetical protein
MDKVWYPKANVLLPSIDTGTHSGQSIAWLVKQLIIGGSVVGGNDGGSPAPVGALWTVVSSSDSVSVSSSDLWTDYTKIIGAAAGTPHSWILLRHTGLGLYLLFDIHGASSWDVYLTTTAPGSGTTSTAPAIVNGSGFSGVNFNNFTAGDWKFSITHANDGHFWMVGAKQNGDGKVHFVLGVPGLLDANVNDQGKEFIIFRHTGVIGPNTLATFALSGSSDSSIDPMIRGRWADIVTGGATLRALMLATGSTGHIFNANWLILRDATSGAYPRFPIWVYQENFDSAGRGNSIRGRLPDVHWGPTGLVSSTVRREGGEIVQQFFDSVWLPFSKVQVQL